MEKKMFWPLTKHTAKSFIAHIYFTITPLTLRYILCTSHYSQRIQQMYSIWQVSWQYNIDLPCGPAVRKVCPAKCEDGPRQFGDDEQHRADTVLHSNMELGLQWSWWTWDLKIIFHATSFSLDIHSNGLKMEIVFKRRLTNELLTTFLPSFLLLLMSYATSFFKPIYFEAAVTVNLSILLVTTTLFIRQGSLPLLSLAWH